MNEQAHVIVVRLLFLKCLCSQHKLTVQYYMNEPSHIIVAIKFIIAGALPFNILVIHQLYLSKIILYSWYGNHVVSN